jgi:hypothetical protein
MMGHDFLDEQASTADRSGSLPADESHTSGRDAIILCR